MKVELLQNIRPEKGIIIEKGTEGYLNTTSFEWPVFETEETGTKWDLTIEENELSDYFRFIR